MPHAIIKLLAGRTEQQKQRIADAVAQAIIASAGIGEPAVSVSMEDVAESDWTDTVYRTDIIGKPAQLYKKPGYDPR